MCVSGLQIRSSYPRPSYRAPGQCYITIPYPPRGTLYPQRGYVLTLALIKGRNFYVYPLITSISSLRQLPTIRRRWGRVRLLQYYCPLSGASAGALARGPRALSAHFCTLVREGSEGIRVPRRHGSHRKTVQVKRPEPTTYLTSSSAPVVTDDKFTWRGGGG